MDDLSATASDDLASRVVATLGEPAARELLHVLTCSHEDRAISAETVGSIRGYSVTNRSGATKGRCSPLARPG